MNINVSKSYIHPIAREYFLKIQAAGGFVSNEKSINNFVIKLSKLIHPSLWVCWPLRSSQSVGTGTIAPSLGGLGDFPGTLVNGPIWSESGLVFGTSQYIISNYTSNQPITIFSVHNVIDNTTSSRLWDSASDQLLFVNSGSTTLQAGSSTLQTVGTITLGQPFSAQIEFNGTNGSVSLNGAQKTQRNMGTNNLSSSLRIGSLSAVQPGRICSFVLASPINNFNLIHNLYKQTLGQGLNLP